MRTSNNDLMYFSVISEAWQGYELKAYGVLNHNLKLQCKKFSRTRDIPNFPTQGWAGTAFCTRKRSETYLKAKTDVCCTYVVQTWDLSIITDKSVLPYTLLTIDFIIESKEETMKLLSTLTTSKN